MKSVFIFLLLFLIKVSAFGQNTLLFTYHDPALGSIYPNGILETKDHGYLLTFGSGSTTLSAVRLDSSGVPLWSRNYSLNSSYLYGIFHRAVELPNHGFILFGDDWNYNCVFLWVDSTGEIVKVLTPSSLFTAYATVQELFPSADGNVVIAGSYLSGFGTGMLMYLMKMDTNGNVIWFRSIAPDTLAQFNTIHGIQLADQGFVFAGDFFHGASAVSEQLFLIRTDSSGQTVWSEKFATFRTRSEPYSLVEQNGHVYIGILSENISHNYIGNLASADLSTGQIEYYKRFDFQYFQIAGFIKSNSNSLYVYGNGQYGIQIVDIDSVGTQLSIKGIYSQLSWIQANQLIGTELNHFVVTGVYDSDFFLYRSDSLMPGGCFDTTATVTFIDSLEAEQVIPVGFNNFETFHFFDLTNQFTSSSTSCQMTNICSPLASSNVSSAYSIDIYPNPCQGAIEISSTEFNQSLGGDILIYDMNMQLLFQKHMSRTEHKFHLNVSELNPGVYLVKIKNSMQSFSGKIIKL